MRPRTSGMLQQNNNNNYPCLSMSGSTREMLQKCSRVALPFPGRLELGDLPLIRGLRAWALCSKTRRKPSGAQAPLEAPPQRRSSCCPRPADVYLSGELGGMGYGLPLGLDARQSGIGALVTVATLKTSEGAGKTQTQCLFLRTEKGSCLYSTTKPSSGGTSGAVGGWLRGKTGVSKDAGRRDPGVPAQSGAPRVRVRSGRRWRKSCNTPGRERAGLSKERRRSCDGGRQEVLHAGQEGASPLSGLSADPGSLRREGHRHGALSAGVKEQSEMSEDLRSSSGLSPDLSLEFHHEENLKTQTVEPNLDVVKSPAEDDRLLKVLHEEQQREETPVVCVVTSWRTSAETRTCDGLTQAQMAEEQGAASCVFVSNCDQSRDNEVTRRLTPPDSRLSDISRCSPEETRPAGSLKDSLGSSPLEPHQSLPDVSEATQTTVREVSEPGAGGSEVSPGQTPKKQQNEQPLTSVSRVSSSPAGGSIASLDGDSYLLLELPSEGRKSECSTEEEEQRGRQKVHDEKSELVEELRETQGADTDDEDDDDDERCQPEEEEDDAAVQRSEEVERSRAEGTFLSGHVVALLNTRANPAPLVVMATSPPRLEEGWEGASRTGREAPDQSEAELENPEEHGDEGDEDDFGVFMQAEGESVWSHPETEPAPRPEDSGSWTPDWTSDDSWTAFPPSVECLEAPGAGPWWPAEEERKSQDLASLFAEAFPAQPSRGSDVDPVPTLTQVLRGEAGRHTRLLDSFHDLNKMIVQRNKRASGASHDLLLRTLHLETPRPDSRPAPWPANRRPSPGLSSANRHSHVVAAKRRLSYDFNRNGGE